LHGRAHPVAQSKSDRMLANDKSKISTLRVVAIAALSLSLVFLIAVITAMATDVRSKLQELSATDVDSVPWQLAQLEVEFLSFKLELREAMNEDAPDIPSMRQKFEVFFNSVEAINQSQSYETLLQNPSFSDALSELTAYRDRLAVLFENNEVTEAIVPRLIDETVPARANIRELALFGVGLFARQTELERAALASVLSRLALLLAALVACLSGALLLVIGLVMRAMTRSRDVLRASARLKAVSENSLEAILVSDGNGHVLDFNASAEEVFGFRAEDMIGKYFPDLIIPDHLKEKHTNGFETYRQTGKTNVIDAGRVQVEAKRATGEVFPLELAISCTDTPDGEIFLAFMRDISDRVAAENALLQARDDALAGERAKSDLLAVMSHEMRTPLNGILGTLELLSRTDLDPEQREHLEIMGKSGDLLLHHVNDVLEMSRLDSGQSEMAEDVFDLPTMMRDIADSLLQLAQSAENEINVVIEGNDLSHVRGASRRLRQVLMNLAGNAVKFTEHGQITLRACRRDGGDAVFIDVSDTGIGIAPENQTRIFDEFVTIDPNYNRKAEGTGLGLAITRRLVEAMGGEIAVNSIPGEGSTFSVELPLPAVPMGRRSVDIDDARKDEDVRFPGLKVLLVEDNPINRRIARAMLDGLQCSVTEASNGIEGVSAAAHMNFDVILMDISMPEMDGVEATQSIRSGPSASSETKIVALTAHAMQEDVDRFQAAGMNDVVVKPISVSRLAEAIDRRRAIRPDAPAIKTDPTWDADTFGEFLAVLGPDETAQMLDRFMSDASEVVPWLVWQSSEELEPAAVAKRAHGLAGSAAVLGATKLHTALRALEQAARKEQPLAEIGAELGKVWDATSGNVPDLSSGDSASAA